MEERGLTILLVGGDLMGRSRIAGAVPGARLVTTRPGRIAESINEAEPDVIVLDLDEGGRDVIEELASINRATLQGRSVLGYYSHVDVEIRKAAIAAGCRAVPRGRFWTSIESLLHAEPGDNVPGDTRTEL